MVASGTGFDQPGLLEYLNARAGSGYWSQDSTVQVLSVPRAATSLWVRWPGGKITTANLPPAAKEIQLTSGEIRLVR